MVNVLRDLVPLLGQQRDALLQEKVQRLLGEQGDVQVISKKTFWIYQESGLKLHYWNVRLTTICLHLIRTLDLRGSFSGNLTEGLPANTSQQELQAVLGPPTESVKGKPRPEGHLYSGGSPPFDRWVYPEYSLDCEYAEGQDRHAEMIWLSRASKLIEAECASMKDPIYMLFGWTAAKIYKDEDGQQNALVYDQERDVFRLDWTFVDRLTSPNEWSETVLSKEEFECEVAMQRKEWLQKHPNLVREARQFAIAVHGFQKYGTLPYESHLKSVADRVWMTTGRHIVCAAAYLHDVLEDCPKVTVSELERRFGGEVARLVVALTKQPGDTPQQYFQRIRAAGSDAVLIKLADRLSNVHACVSEQPNSELLEKYRREQPLLEAILNPGRGDDSILRALRAEFEKSQRPS